MKFALIGAAAVAAAAFVTPALAQAVTSNPGYCAEFYPNANCQNWGPGNSYTDNSQNRMADNNAYRYHGGPKYND
jgi:ABC-type multidrug transport system permease subunit